MTLLSKIVAGPTLEERVTAILPHLVPPTKSARLQGAELHLQAVRKARAEIEEQLGALVRNNQSLPEAQRGGSAPAIQRLQRASDDLAPARHEASRRLDDARETESTQMLRALEGPHEEARAILVALLDQVDLVATALRDVENFAITNRIQPPKLFGLGSSFQATVRHMKALVG